MNEIIKNFTEKHPYLTYSLVVTGFTSVANIVVGISRAITGNYPDNQLVKVDNPSLTLGNTPAKDDTSEVTEDTTEAEPAEA